MQRENDVVQKPVTQFVHSYNSEYYAGTLNPLATRTITKCLTIDTRFRNNVYTTMSTDFTAQLPLKLSKVVSMQLASIEMPFSFYGISKTYGNYYLNLEIEYEGSSGNRAIESNTIFVSEGNYTSHDLISEVNHAVYALGGVWQYVYFTLDVNTSGSGSGKSRVDISGNSAINGYTVIQLTMDNRKNQNGFIDTTEIYQKLAWNLGFTQLIYHGSSQYVSDSVVNPCAIRYLYLAIEDFNNSVNNHFVTAFNSSILSPNILARISVKGNYFQWMMENDHVVVTEPRKYFGPVDIQRLKIQLFDDRGRILDMNNSNYSFCLNFKLLYDM
jgi:hypothetical protein